MVQLKISPFIFLLLLSIIVINIQTISAKSIVLKDVSKGNQLTDSMDEKIKSADNTDQYWKETLPEMLGIIKDNAKVNQLADGMDKKGDKNDHAHDHDHHDKNDEYWRKMITEMHGIQVNLYNIYSILIGNLVVAVLLCIVSACMCCLVCVNIGRLTHQSSIIQETF